jgi:hypothetical protein
MTTEIVCDDDDIPSNCQFRCQRARRCSPWNCARRHTWSPPCHRVRLRPCRPWFSWALLIVQGRFDAVASGRPAWSWIKGARHYQSEFIGTDGRRPRCWRGIVGDDRRPFGTKSLSRGVPPAVCLPPSDPFAQQDTADLAAFDPDAGRFGRLRQGIEAPLG